MPRKNTPKKRKQNPRILESLEKQREQQPEIETIIPSIEKKQSAASLSNNEKPLPKLTGDWYAVAEAVVGLAHRRVESPLPCQDAFCISTKPRLALLTNGAS